MSATQLDAFAEAILTELRAAGLLRQLRPMNGPQGPRLRVDGREVINFSSNDYLGLANDPILRDAATRAIERYGVGAGASRLVCGNFAPYAELEARLAEFKGKQAAVVFSSGYAANVGTIGALVARVTPSSSTSSTTPASLTAPARAARPSASIRTAIWANWSAC